MWKIINRRERKEELALLSITFFSIITRTSEGAPETKGNTEQEMFSVQYSKFSGIVAERVSVCRKGNGRVTSCS